MSSDVSDPVHREGLFISKATSKAQPTYLRTDGRTDVNTSIVSRDSDSNPHQRISMHERMD